MVSFTIDDTTISAKLSAAAERLSDFSVPLDTAADELLNYYGVEVFNDQGSDGTSWAPWAFTTVLERMKHEGYYAQSAEREDQILVWTGNLHRSFQKTVTSNQITIFNTAPYFAKLQNGDGRTPARPMLTLNKTVIAMVTRELNDYAALAFSL